MASCVLFLTSEYKTTLNWSAQNIGRFSNATLVRHDFQKMPKGRKHRRRKKWSALAKINAKRKRESMERKAKIKERQKEKILAEVCNKEHVDYETPPNNAVQCKAAFDECNRRLRKCNLDALGFEPSFKSNQVTLLVHSPAKIDGSDGRTYVLGSDRLRARVEELDPHKKTTKYASVVPFRKIGLTPPKHARRRLDLEIVRVDVDVDTDTTRRVDTDTGVLLSNSVPAPVVQPKPKAKAHGVYVPVLDPYMLGSTDYSEVLTFIEHVVCGYRREDGTICCGHLHDIRIPCSGSGGALNFKVFCDTCGKEHVWGPDLTPQRNDKGRFTKQPQTTYCNVGERRLYSVSVIHRCVYV